jgi:hypothetical protein
MQLNCLICPTGQQLVFLGLVERQICAYVQMRLQQAMLAAEIDSAAAAYWQILVLIAYSEMAPGNQTELVGNYFLVGLWTRDSGSRYLTWCRSFRRLRMHVWNNLLVVEEKIQVRNQ